MQPTGVIKLFGRGELAYGENRYQSPAHLIAGESDDPLAPTQGEWISGVPSYISIADGVQIVDILRLLAEAFRRWNTTVPYIAIAGKHGNPCGAAISWKDPLEAVSKALMGDTVAVMGGEVVTNFPIGEKEAETLFRPTDEIGRDKWGLDLIIAPGFSENATYLLGQREKRRLFANPALRDAPFPKQEWAYRPAGADWLRQAAPTFVLTPREVEFWSGKEMNAEQFENALIAFACCWRASSNTVALANDRMLIGLGCGQQDRIACVRLCLDRANRAGHDTRGSVFASDAFFPYATSSFGWSNADGETCMMAMQQAASVLGASVMVEDARVKAIGQAEAIKAMAKVSAMISRMDRREGTELLIDAGCAGGIVPADGKELENVRRLFQDYGLAVGFVPAKYRGFSKH